MERDQKLSCDRLQSDRLRNMNICGGVDTTTYDPHRRATSDCSDEQADAPATLTR